nr:hypothetical protein [Tanacetum cinerariifolium]
GVVIRDPEEESTRITPVDTMSKDKSKGIMVEEPKPLKKKQQVKMDEEFARKLHEELNKDIDCDMAIDHVKQKTKEDPAVQRYQVMKKRPQTEAQARKNMITYLKNVVEFRLDYFKGMSYDDIRPIFKAKFNSNMDFLLKTREQIEEEERRAIQSINETLAQKAAKRRKLNEERIDTSDDAVMEDASNQGRMIDDLDRDEDVVFLDDKEKEKKAEEAKVAGDDQVQGRQAEIYQIDLDHASKVLKVDTAASESVTAASTTISAAESQVPTATITVVSVRVAAASTKRRKGVVIRDPKEESTRITPVDTKSKDKSKGIMDIDCDMAIDHVKQKTKEDPAVQRYQVMKKRPQTEAQARKNMITYLKNVVEFRLDYFKGMSYDDIPQKAAKRRKLNEEVEDLNKNLEIMPDEDDDVYTEDTPFARKPDDFFDDFLLTTLGTMFGKLEGQAQVWKSQRTVHGQARVKSWKLLESCSVHIITFSTT